MATSNKVIFKFGTRAKYNALANKLDNALYFLTDTGELYRGTVPFGQARVFQGLKYNSETEAAAIARIIGSSPLAYNDLLIMRNNDDTMNLYIYTTTGWIKLTQSTVPVSRIDALDNRVTGLNGRVDTLETTVADLNSRINALNSALHFVDRVNDLSEVLNPENGGIYQVGNKEYAWNGTEFVELGDLIDTSNLATKIELNEAIADLEALIGKPEHDEVEPTTGETIHHPASGLYAEIFNYQQEIPEFDGVIAGLVPVLTGNYTPEQKESMFLNALGEWVQVTSEGGVTYYVATDGQRFTSLTDYVEHMIEITPHKWIEFDT